LWIAFGGVLPEAIYSGIAYYILGLLHLSPLQTESLQLIGACVITLIGVGFIYQANTNKKSTQLKKVVPRAGIFYGFMYGIGNMQLILFWISVLGYSGAFMLTGSDKIAQVAIIMLGSTLGAFAALYLFIFLVSRNKERILKYIAPNYINMGIGIILIGLGLYQIITVFW